MTGASPQAIAVELRVYGRVQGVAFRDSTRRAAQRLGVCGFVRNEADGSVFVHAEGEAASVERLAEWCRRGPSSASVARVERCAGAVLARTDFRIEW